MKNHVKKIRILWFANTPSAAAKKYGVKSQNSGSWIEASELALREQKNISLAVAFLTDINEPPKFEFNGGTYYPIKRKRLGKFFGNKDAFSNKDLLWAVQDFRPDLIQVFGTEGPFGQIARSLDIPVIIRIQMFLQSVSKAVSVGVRPIDILKRANIAYLFAVFFKYFSFKRAIRREKMIIESNRFFIGITQWDRDFLSLSANDHIYFANNEIIRRIFFQNHWRGKAGRTATIISVISARPNKGLEQILETASILKKSNFHFRWKVAGVLAGNNLVKIIEKTAKKTFAQNNVEFVGTLGEKDLVKILMRSEIYVHPSHIENKSVSVIEAMVLGMPVIANFVGGMSDLIQNDLTGILVPDGDFRLMAAKIIGLHNDPQRAKSLGQKAQAYTSENFNTTKSIRDLMKIYREVVEIYSEKRD